MTFSPTPEQLAVVEAVRTTSSNILIQALAGAAKTTTLELIAQALPGRPILCVAFNKKIADEMAKRLPSHCVAKTLNSIGHTAWGSFIGKRLTVDTRKTGKILQDAKGLSRSEKDELREIFGDVVKLVQRAKLLGYVPEGRFEEVIHLISRETLEEVLAEDEYPQLGWWMLDSLLCESIAQAYRGLIDFDDQLYMATLFGAQLPRFPLTLVDEAQDLSPLNHFMIERLVGDRRLCAVGDRYQSIYRFRGAVSNGLDMLRVKFNMTEFKLSISFRCPRSVILLARGRAPYMQWSEVAIEGEVKRLTEPWGPKTFPLGSAVICRNNAPLFSLGLKLLRAGVGVTMRGFDISKRLVKILEEFGDREMPREILLGHLEAWRANLLSEGKLRAETIEDRYLCLKVFAEATPTLGAAIGHAETLFKSEGPVELLSGHKSKGLEWPHVFHLDPWRIPSKWAVGAEELEQERNLEYVITTRAKQTLTLLDLDKYDEEV